MFSFISIVPLLIGNENSPLFSENLFSKPSTILILTPLNLILNEDYAIGYEQLIYGAGNRITPLLNESLPELEDVKWLGSKITYEGNFVWKKDLNK